MYLEKSATAVTFNDGQTVDENDNGSDSGDDNAMNEGEGEGTKNRKGE